MSTLEELWKAVDDAWDALIKIERQADHVAATEEMSAQAEEELRLAEARYRAARNVLDAAETQLASTSASTWSDCLGLA